MYRVCIDTGGTFTEIVVLDAQGKFHEFKTPTTPWAFSEGVLNTIKEAASYYQISSEDFLKQTKWIEDGEAKGLPGRAMLEEVLSLVEQHKDLYND